jgi:hypothetical protein
LGSPAPPISRSGSPRETIRIERRVGAPPGRAATYQRMPTMRRHWFWSALMRAEIGNSPALFGGAVAFAGLTLWLAGPSPVTRLPAASATPEAESRRESLCGIWERVADATSRTQAAIELSADGTCSVGQACGDTPEDLTVGVYGREGRWSVAGDKVRLELCDATDTRVHLLCVFDESLRLRLLQERYAFGMPEGMYVRLRLRQQGSIFRLLPRQGFPWLRFTDVGKPPFGSIEPAGHGCGPDPEHRLPL